MRSCRQSVAFTLVELLVVIGTIAVLAAVLFPVFASVRERARQTSCASNLHQIGTALTLYAQDYDGLYAYGADALDKNSGLWSLDPQEESDAQAMPYLQDVLAPYLHAPAVWRCPSDSGFDVLQEWGDPATNAATVLAAHPSCYAAFGTSYKYNTQFAFQQKLLGADAYTIRPVGSANYAVLTDLSGSWHSQDGQDCVSGYAYMTLFADGHVKRLPNDQWADVFFVSPNP